VTTRHPLLALVAAAGTAFGYGYFGKNKVHYYEHEWQVIQTDHVDLYFYAPEQELAERAVAIAEETWAEYTLRLGFTPPGRVPLIIYASHGEFEETNILPYVLPEGVAGFTELFKNRVVVPFDGSYARFRRVLRHELAHYFMFERLRVAYARHNRFDYGAPPFWLTEGFAEYMSGEGDAMAEMVLADALYGGAVVPLTKGDALAGTFLGYKEGESALRYLAASYGEDKVVKLLDQAWLSRNWREVLDLTLPVSFTEFDAEWRRWLRQRYWPRVAARAELAALGPALTAGRGLRSGVAWVDERRLAYLSDEDGYATLYLLTLDDEGKPTKRRRLVKGERSDAFVVVHVFQERLATFGGRYIAFVARSGPRDRLNIYDLRDDAVAESYEFADLAVLGSPSFSPDGRAIVFRGITREGRADLYAVTRATGERRQLTADLADDAYPCWTDKGIVFASGRGAGLYDDHYNLYLLDDAGQVTRLTAGPWRDLYPLQGQDGVLYFVSDRDGLFDLYALAGDGPSRRVVAAWTGILEAAPRPGREAEMACVAIVGQSYEITLATLPAAAETAPEPAPLMSPPPTPPTTPPYKSYAVKRYKTKYGLDYFSAQVSYGPEFGTATGFIVALTDQLSDRNIFVGFGNDAQTLDEFLARTSVGVEYYDLHRRLGLGGGAFHYVNDYFDYRAGVAGLYYSETRAGGGFTVTYPFDRFHRAGASIYAYELKREWEVGAPPAYGTKVAPYLSATRDTSLWYRDGPLDGQRAEVTVGVTEDVRRTRADYLYVNLDFRHYLRTTRSQCLAVRLAAVGTFGPDARPLYAGGSLSMRGYNFFDFRGRRLAIGNVEYRFPILEPFPLPTALGTATMPPVRGALFADVGNGWDERFGPPRGGFGLSLRAVLGNVLTLRTDHTCLTDFKSLGPFVPIKFFVGWSY